MGGQGGGPRRGARYLNALRRVSARSTFPGVPVFRTWQSLQRGGTLAELPHRAQSSVRVNANRDSLSHAQAGAFSPFARLPSIASEQWPPSPRNP